MPRDSGQYLQDIVEAIVRIQSYIAGMDENSFARDTRTQDAVLPQPGSHWRGGGAAA
jgi:uncharacterized protein with HEPN domain